MKKKKAILAKDKIKSKQAIPATFDAINRRLKLRFNVQNINYVSDNGIIQKGWLITKDKDIDDAIYLLEKQLAPIYILGHHFNAVFNWDSSHDTVIAGLWRYGKKVDETNSADFKILKLTMIDWLDKCTEGGLI